jgi:hypothetical protein
MNIFSISFAAVTGISCLVAGSAAAQTVYLNKENISVSVGSGTSPGSFNNTFANGATIQKVIDAPSAIASEFHDQQTHIWFTSNNVGGGLQLLFDFQKSYDIKTLHFWNYDEESYDVDSLAFSFYDASNLQIGSLSITPALGSSPAIFAQDIPLAAPLNVRYVSAFLTGSNREVDFQNIGFTASVSAVPEPESYALMVVGLMALGAYSRRRLRAKPSMATDRA